jgi:hypothetical protein
MYDTARINAAVWAGCRNRGGSAGSSVTWVMERAISVYLATVSSWVSAASTGTTRPGGAAESINERIQALIASFIMARQLCTAIAGVVMSIYPIEFLF